TSSTTVEESSVFFCFDCIINNNLIFSAAALVESPSNVRVQATSNSSAVVQWDYNGQNVSEFEVRFMQQPLAGERHTEKWSSRVVSDPSVRHLHIHHLTPGRSYAFCVAAIRDGRQSPCSDPPVAIERLDPTYVVSGLRLEFKTSNSVKLAWSYNGSRSVQFYVRYSGNKSYVDNNGKYFENNILPIEKNIFAVEYIFLLLTELRPDMKYIIKVGVKENGRAYFPSEITVKTKCRASPVVDPPEFIGSRDINTASLMLGLASEEYGPISYYWLIVLPGNFSVVIYVAANFSADVVRRKKRNNESFLLGDGEVMIYFGLRWQRCNRKGSSHNSNRHASVTKVAIGNIIPSETSKLLPSEYGRQIVNPYDQANGSNGCIMEPTTDIYPSQQAANFTATSNAVSMLPSSGGVLGGHTLNHPPIPIRELASHIESLKMNNNALFSQEYESIETGQPFKWDNSTLPCNKLKNRYANVVAYDHSRVELSVLGDDPSTDYINANYIDGYEKTKAYIATQGPLSETFDDFWRMVWEQNSLTIVMLTRLEESSRIKCDQYWPSRGSTVYGHITVALVDTLELAHYTIRTFVLQYRGNSEKREVHHLQYTAWPDHGVPEKPTPFLMFLKRVKTINPRKAGPIVTHCSAGIGRTGAFIAIDCMLERLRYENSVDIFGCVTALRSQRSYMVQTEEQYIFIYDAVLDAAQSGSTEVPVSKLHTHIQRLLQTDSREPMISGMELEFRHLATLKMVNSRCAVANLQVNRGKNRLLNMVPYDSTRVVLEGIPGVSGSDYINASWIDGYRQRNAYIATQGPMECTVNDFWRMIWEKESAIIVMLVQVREFGQEKCFEYWPVDSGVNFEHLYVEPIAEYNMSQYILREFRMTDTKSRTVRHFQYMDWPERGIPKFTDHFIDFIHQVHHTKTQFGNVGPITVHCSTGTGRTGVFIALSIIIDRLKLEKVVDVFTTVKLLRTERQNMVQDKDQYHFCYQAALDFYQTCDNPYQT
uniref:protein-tyrosine-phosphatase n=1 Tax=Syphacia muris TaxID=451379 RepID=A0A0N5B044_9BILA